MTEKLEKLMEIEVNKHRAIHNDNEIEPIVDFRMGAKAGINLILQSPEFKGAVKALKFYSPKENWSEFISGGGVFDEQDGDFCEAFENKENNGPDRGSSARAALTALNELTGGVE